MMKYIRLSTVACYTLLFSTVWLAGSIGYDNSEGNPNKATKLLPGLVSTGAELSQTVSADGERIFFARMDANGDWNIYATHKDGNEWSTPVKTGFSTSHMEADPFISPDGNRLFFMSTRPIMPDGEPQEAPNIWYAERKGEDWGEPIFLRKINSEQFGEGFMSLDRSGTIYFSSNRPNGSHDIFYAAFEGNQYSSPKPLEADLVTSFSNPLISGGGNFLIFDSDAYRGFGSADLLVIFRTKKGWTKPVNLGPEINTKLSESAPFISGDGRHLFFGRTRVTDEGFESDLYQVHFPPILKRAKQKAGV